jgi:hypothetical protein
MLTLKMMRNRRYRTMSKNYAKVKGFYETGLWSIRKVHDAVGKWITPEEYAEITGEEYTED